MIQSKIPPSTDSVLMVPLMFCVGLVSFTVAPSLSANPVINEPLCLLLIQSGALLVYTLINKRR